MTAPEPINLRAALAYARAGWPVFPCIPGEKAPATARGFKDATTDPGQITAWWRRNPGRNVAIATGRPGPDVLDIDMHKNGSGFPALRRLRDEGLIGNPRTVIRTPSGGLHLYWRGSEQHNGSIRGQHVDFRSTGGYVLAPPSAVRRAADGQLRPYLVVRHQASTDRLDWAAVRQRLDPQPEPKAWTPTHQDGRPQDLAHLAAWVAGQPEGNRNAGLFWAANRALDHGQPGILDGLRRAAVSAGLPGREADRTIESAVQQPRQAGPAVPRHRVSEQVNAVRRGGREAQPVKLHNGPHAARAAHEPAGPEHRDGARGRGRGPEREADPDIPQRTGEHQASHEPGRGVAAGPGPDREPGDTKAERPVEPASDREAGD